MKILLCAFLNAHLGFTDCRECRCVYYVLCSVQKYHQNNTSPEAEDVWLQTYYFKNYILCFYLTGCDIGNDSSKRKESQEMCSERSSSSERSGDLSR